ncbi:hypothetical protein [Kangiella sediminilitoris]|uniref:Lipoprotein n=1 Tax=Kangiella sediminilitoris TaxID=1144748 RepID=A0A1B3BBS9_9GAMM|nr:hypothetical protein [Kangiella sediminilitoris]AOE50254.1 hypothetical protein KS2013_1544 [Kangiella sediminilitoris]
MNQLKRSVVLAFVVTLMTGCASIQPAEVDTKLTAWKGANIDAVIQTWGVPTADREINGKKYAEWNTREIKNQPSFNIGVGGFGGNFFGSVGTRLFGGKKELYCTVQVGYNQEGIVTQTNWTGDPGACDAAIPERTDS